VLVTTWLITGCSSGLGRALAEAVLSAGDRAVVTARDGARVSELARRHPGSAVPLTLDVTRRDQVAEAARVAEERFGGVDVLVNNAGFGYRAAVEEGEEAAVRRLFDTHVHGPVALIKAVLPGMRARRSGTILNISSAGARTAPPGSGYYSSAKCALEGLSRALRKEVAPLGIRVTIVEPGAFRTDFAGRSLTGSSLAIDDYEATVGGRRPGIDRVHGTQPGDPLRAARVLREVVASEELPALLLLGSDAVSEVKATLAAETEDILRWQATSVRTDFPPRNGS
jgi:NAD(P)-dependent dehydrogenase (short-subunit alcohol dehydrogenase family)